MERIVREIRRQTRLVGAFSDGQSALMLYAARLRHNAGTKWETRRYLNMEPLFKQALEPAIARAPPRRKCARYWTLLDNMTGATLAELVGRSGIAHQAPFRVGGYN